MDFNTALHFIFVISFIIYGYVFYDAYLNRTKILAISKKPLLPKIETLHEKPYIPGDFIKKGSNEKRSKKS